MMINSENLISQTRKEFFICYNLMEDLREWSWMQERWIILICWVLY